MNAIGKTIMRWQDAIEAFDDAVGQIHELNSADRRCLSFVTQRPQTASAIAKETALTPAPVTTLIDRLEARGLVHRRPDASDRRKVLVGATARTHDLIRRTYAPIARAGAELLASYSPTSWQPSGACWRKPFPPTAMTAALLEREGSKH